MRRTLSIASLCALAVACGDDSSPAAAPVVPAPTPPPTAPAVRGATPPSPPPLDEPSAAPLDEAAGPQVLGGDARGLIILDPDSGAVTRRDVGAVRSARWLACGAQVAYHAGDRVHLVERGGVEVSSIEVPDMVRAQRGRLAERVARVWLGGDFSPEAVTEMEETLESLRAASELERLVVPAELARTVTGRLAMDPRVDLSLLHGEEEGCTPLARSMRVQLGVDGVRDVECEWPDRGVVRMPRDTGDRSPSGWRCAEATVESDEPPWLAVRSSRSVRNEGGRFTFGDLEIVGLVICRPPGDPERRTVSLVREEAMGCLGNPPMFVVRGAQVEADLGADAKVRQYGKIRLYGGANGWWAQYDDKELRPAGDFEPDVVNLGSDAASE